LFGSGRRELVNQDIRAQGESKPEMQERGGIPVHTRDRYGKNMKKEEGPKGREMDVKTMKG